MQKGIIELARELKLSKLPVSYEPGTSLTSKMTIDHVSDNQLTVKETGRDRKHVVIDDGINLLISGLENGATIESDHHKIHADEIVAFEDGYIISKDYERSRRLVTKEDIRKVRVEFNGRLETFNKDLWKVSIWDDRTKLYSKKDPTVFSPEIKLLAATDVEKAKYFVGWVGGVGAVSIDRENVAAIRGLKDILGHIMFMKPLGRDHYRFHLDTHVHQIASDQDINDRTGRISADTIEDLGDFFRITRPDYMRQLMAKDPLGKLLDPHFHIELDRTTGAYTFNEVDGTSTTVRAAQVH